MPSQDFHAGNRIVISRPPSSIKSETALPLLVSYKGDAVRAANVLCNGDGTNFYYGAVSDDSQHMRGRVSDLHVFGRILRIERIF